MGFSRGSDGKESACNTGDPGLIPGLGRSPGEGNGNPNSSIFAGKFREQIGLAGYNPRCLKESDATEQLTHTPILQRNKQRYCVVMCSS